MFQNKAFTPTQRTHLLVCYHWKCNTKTLLSWGTFRLKGRIKMSEYTSRKRSTFQGHTLGLNQEPSGSCCGAHCTTPCSESMQLCNVPGDAKYHMTYYYPTRPKSSWSQLQGLSRIENSHFRKTLQTAEHWPIKTLYFVQWGLLF